MIRKTGSHHIVSGQSHHAVSGFILLAETVPGPKRKWSKRRLVVCGEGSRVRPALWEKLIRLREVLWIPVCGPLAHGHCGLGRILLAAGLLKKKKKKKRMERAFPGM